MNFQAYKDAWFLVIKVEGKHCKIIASSDKKKSLQFPPALWDGQEYHFLEWLYNIGSIQYYRIVARYKDTRFDVPDEGGLWNFQEEFLKFECNRKNYAT